MNSKQLWPKCYFAHWTQHGGAAVGPDRPALMAQHSESTVWLPAHKDPYVPLSAGPKWLKGCKRPLRPFSILTLNHFGLSTLLHILIPHLSSGKCNVCVWKVGISSWLVPMGSFYKPVQATADKGGHFPNSPSLCSTASTFSSTFILLHCVSLRFLA